MSEVTPRTRIVLAAPGVPLPAMMVTPGALACSSSPTFMLTTFSMTSAALIVVIALPSVRLDTGPAVPVTTCSSSVMGRKESAKSARTVSPSATEIVCSTLANPIIRTRTVCGPAGTLTRT